MPSHPSYLPSRLRQQFGCWLYERWQAEIILRFPRVAAQLGWSWMDLHNRHESLVRLQESDVRICQWRDSSRLTLAHVFPGVARRLFAHCFRQAPISLRPPLQSPAVDDVDASVLIAIGGADRVGLLDTVLRSLLTQVGVKLEIIVCELGPIASLRSAIPDGVRYRHVIDTSRSSFNKSRALNAAAEIARGRVLFIHDADYVVPTRYAADALQLLGNADGARPCRLLFYASRSMTESIQESRSFENHIEFESVVQNNPTPVIVTADAYRRIGGHDEDYVGWGGEDTEFMSRLRTGRVIEGGTSYGVHLWHPPAKQKLSGHRNRKLHEQKMRLSADERIAKLHMTGQSATTTIREQAATDSELPLSNAMT